MSHGDDKRANISKKFLNPTGDVEIDAAKAQFVDLMQQLRDAYKNGDSDTVESIKDQLGKLRQILQDARNSKL